MNYRFAVQPTDGSTLLLRMKNLLIFFCLLSAPVLAKEPPFWKVLERQTKTPPQASPEGNYDRPNHNFWIVIAESGLQGRFKQSLQDPESHDLSDNRFEKWPVVNYFPAGTILTASCKGSTMGAETWVDQNGQLWLRVQAAGLKGGDCFVRSNSKLIRPVKVLKNW